MYAITAIINRTGVDKTKGFPEGWESSRSLPTFYLDERTQGILSCAGAVGIAMAIVLPLGPVPDTTVSVTAVRVPGPDNDL
jgi:hypothetical protein